MKLRIRPRHSCVLLACSWLALAAAPAPHACAQATNAPTPPTPATPEERARLREELQRLTPEERRARLRALRPAPNPPAPTRPDAAERRRELLQRKIHELRQKKAAGNITPPEQAFLERLERALAQREAARATNAPPAAPTEPPARSSPPAHPAPSAP
jgi:hypothetical protein